MQLPVPGHRFQRLPPSKFLGLQRLWRRWRMPVQESGIRQHPGTRGYGSDGAFLAEAKYMDIAYRQYPHPLSVKDGEIWCGIKWRQLWLVRRRHQQQIPLHTGRPIHYPVVVWSSPLICLGTQQSFSGSKNCKKSTDPVVFYRSWIKMSSHTKQSAWIQFCMMRKRGVSSKGGHYGTDQSESRI